jgi:hypothetical protein
MDHEPARQRAFAPACPSCQKGDGQPRTVTLYDGQRTVRYVCCRCQHTWEDTTVDDAGLFYERSP